MIEWICRFIRSRQIKATIGIQRNGTLLDRSLIKLFEQHNIQVGISLDGPPDIQEWLRGGAILTLRDLNILTEYNVAFSVTTVVTRENIRFLSRLALMLSSFPTACGIGLDLLVKIGDDKFKCGNISNINTDSLSSLGKYGLESDLCRVWPASEYCPGDCPSRLHYDGHQGYLACAMYRTLFEEWKR